MEFLEEIWTTIRQNRSRSLMTGFGVFWGMMMLLVLVGIGQGFTGGIRDAVGSMPANAVMMGTSRTSKPYKGFPQGRNWNIQLSDLDVVRDEAKTINKMSPMVWGDNSDKNVRHDDIEESFSIQGVLPTYSQLFSLPMQYGRFINDMDISGYRKVCYIGHTVYEKMFPEGGNVVGEILFLSNIPYRIIGVGQKQKQGFGNSDDVVLLPITTLQRAYNRGQEIHQLVVSARPGVKAADAEQEVKTILRRIHNIAPNDEKALWAWNIEEMFTGISYTILGLTILLWLIGLGTLISGAVGVMNIMLVTIRERTREIGIRRALGASPWVIVRQILAESLLLTTLSGLMGIMAGIGILNILGPIMANADSELPLNAPEVSFGLAMGALLIIVVIGLLAGLMPALRALKIKPIEALSEE